MRGFYLAGVVFSRLKRLVSSHVAAMADALKTTNPEQAMDDALQEVDKALNGIRREMGLAIADQHNAGKALAEAKTRAGEIDAEITAAIAEGLDDKAAAALNRQLDLEAHIAELEMLAREAAEAQSELEESVSMMADLRRDMVEDKERFLEARADAADDAAYDDQGVDGSPMARAERAYNNFNRILEDVMSATEKAVLPVESDVPQTDDKFAKDRRDLDALSREAQVEARLKARMAARKTASQP